MKIIHYLQRSIELVREYLIDLRLFAYHNSYSPFENKGKGLFYRIIITAHTIEKGLSLANPRPLFGRDKIYLIMELVQKYGVEQPMFPVMMVTGALEKYCETHRAWSISDPLLDEIETFLATLKKRMQFCSAGGVKDIGGVFDKIRGNSYSYAEFIQSRFSCRVFQDTVLDRNQVASIVNIAQSAPSQCNRQSVRVHSYHEKSQISSLLKLQAGSNGFSDEVYNLFVITSEITAWGGPGQRNQAYIDGALFAMNLLLSCHASGVAACPLNLAILNSKEEAIKQVAGIDRRERLIMMIAFGYIKQETVYAAMSPRLTLDEIITFHESAKS